MAKRMNKSQPNDIASSSDAPKPAGRSRSRTPAQSGAPAPERVTDADGIAEVNLGADPSSSPQGHESPGQPSFRKRKDDARRSTSMGSEPSEEDIRMRAYHLYLERGAEPGRHDDDWLRAERELKKRA